MEASHGSHAVDPLHQFEVTPLLPLHIAGLDVSFTNASLYMLLAIGAVTLFFSLAMKPALLIPGRFQSLAEVIFEFVGGTLKESVGKEGMQYFPFIFSIFMFVLICNLLGMVPFFGYTVTSHIIVTFGLSALVFVSVTVIALARHGVHFFSYFVPKGVPLALAFIIVPIEVFAYLIRPITLSIRLAANMTAGHLILKVMAGFILTAGVVGVLPFGFIVLMSGYEFFVAVLQAYIFTMLTCVYLHDAVHLH